MRPFRIRGNFKAVKTAVLPLALTSMMSVPVAYAQDDSYETASYAAGVQFAVNLMDQGAAEVIDIDSLVAGVKDALAEEPLQYTPEEMQTAFQMLLEDLEEKLLADMAEFEAEQRDYLVMNSEKDGVETTPSGLQYRVIEAGSGGVSPTPEDTVLVHYKGTLTDGTVFDSSVSRGEPLEAPLSGVLPGWSEGIQMMSVGDYYEFVLPSELGLGEAGVQGIVPPNSTLIYEVELLDVL